MLESRFLGLPVHSQLQGGRVNLPGPQVIIHLYFQLLDPNPGRRPRALVPPESTHPAPEHWILAIDMGCLVDLY